MSVVLLVLLANLTLLMKIRYGDQLVTKLSEQPYIIALAFITSILVYLIGLCYLTSVPYDGKLDDFYQQMIKPGTTLNVLNTVFIIIRMDLALLFIASRIYEQEALLLFVMY